MAHEYHRATDILHEEEGEGVIRHEVHRAIGRPGRTRHHHHGAAAGGAALVALTTHWCTTDDTPTGALSIPENKPPERRNGRSSPSLRSTDLPVPDAPPHERHADGVVRRGVDVERAFLGHVRPERGAPAAAEVDRVAEDERRGVVALEL